MSDVPTPDGSTPPDTPPRPPTEGKGVDGPAATAAKDGGSQADSASIGLTFVEMAFAVALGDAASQVAKVMKFVGQTPAPIVDDLIAVAPSLAHLALTIVVIATSWVGWYNSLATHKYMRQLKSVLAPNSLWLITLPFFMLLIDVFLVVCYFNLSETAEIPEHDADNGLYVVASAKAEAAWIMAIFATYLLWNALNLLHAWWFGGERLCGSERVARIVAAIVSLGLTCGAFWKSRFVTTPEAVLYIDGALLAAVLTFRLRGVDDKGRLQQWDAVRGAALAAVGVAMIWRAAVLG